MWYACSISLNRWFNNSPISNHVELSSGVCIEPVPSWVKEDDALKLLSWTDREHIRDAELAFAVEYEADALGSPDPEWKGTSPRSIQSVVDEKISLASVALWLAKPTRLTCGPILHFGRKGDSASLRQAGSLRPVLIREEEKENVPTTQDIAQARHLLSVILSLRRDATIWTAMRMLIPALTESVWESRFLWQWVVLEALFGPESPHETTYRLAQRISLFVGNEPDERKRLFDESKQAYSWRSKIVHGRRLSKLKSEKAEELTKTTEHLIRIALTKILLTPDYLYQFDGKERDSFLDGLAFR